MEFQPIESLSPYKDLVPQEDRASELGRFVNEWLTPQLDQINELRLIAYHKDTMRKIATVALGINSQLSSWIPRAERYKRQRKNEISGGVRERALADKKAGVRSWTEPMIKAQIDADMAVWDALVQSLEMVRQDMSTYISFAQTTMKTMTTEEYSGNLQT